MQNYPFAPIKNKAHLQEHFNNLQVHTPDFDVLNSLFFLTAETAHTP